MYDSKSFVNVEQLHHPTNLYDQVDAVVRFIFDALLEYKDGIEPYYESLGSLPNRLNAATMLMFKHRDVYGYRSAVIRKAHAVFDEIGYINTDMPPLSDDELIDYR